MKKASRFLYAVVAASLICSMASADAQKVRVIILGGIPGSGGQPAPGELSSYVEKAAALPVDGFVYNATLNGGFFADDPFFVYGKRFTYDQLSPDVKTIKGMKLGNLKHNYVRLNIGLIRSGWYDDQGWEAILANVRLASRCAAEGGAEGLLLDTEQYHAYTENAVRPFSYKDQPDNRNKFFTEYEKQVRKRGREFMEAVNAYMPDAKLIFTFANSAVAIRKVKNPKYPTTASDMSLIPAFIDGMMDTATPKTEIIDGFEYSYYYKTEGEFKAARELIKNTSAELSADPARYRKLIKVGFGVFPHGGKFEGSLSSDISKNTLTPEEFGTVLKAAAKYSDGYFWLYALPWLAMPQPYMDVAADFHAKRPDVYRWPAATPARKPSVKGAKGSYTFPAKTMRLTNASDPAGRENWSTEADYILLAVNHDDGGAIHATGTVEMRPTDTKRIKDGLYQVVIDLQHANMKKENAGDPPGDRNGSFSYRVSLSPESSGMLAYERVSSETLTYYPQDPDNCDIKYYVGQIALPNFVAYGPKSPVEGARGYIRLNGVKASDLVFEISENEVGNYAYIGARAIKLIPAK